MPLAPPLKRSKFGAELVELPFPNVKALIRPV